MKGTAMARPSKFSHPTDQAIYEVHRRYIALMEGDRLSEISEETKGRYLMVLQSLTEKLAIPGKPLSEVIREIMSEAAPILFQVMQH
ncbi:MAG: hypothetical protein ACREP6_13985 [Candidatus Binataceae bacterium]